MTKTRTAKDSISVMSTVWKTRFESSEMERKKLEEQLTVHRNKTEYYESGAVKSEESTSINSSRESTSEKNKNTISEQQAAIDKLTQEKSELKQENERLTRINSELSEEANMRSKTQLSEETTKMRRGFFWWLGLGCAAAAALAFLCWIIFLKGRK